MAESFLEMAERNLRESEARVIRHRAHLTALEATGDKIAIADARALLHLLEAARDVHRTLLAQERAKLKPPKS